MSNLPKIIILLQLFASNYQFKAIRLWQIAKVLMIIHPLDTTKAA